MRCLQIPYERWYILYLLILRNEELTSLETTKISRVFLVYLSTSIAFFCIHSKCAWRCLIFLLLTYCSYLEILRFWSSYCLHCPYSILACVDTAQFPLFRNLILTLLDNTQYLVHEFDDTAQYSVFRYSILVKLILGLVFMRCKSAPHQQLRAGRSLLYIWGSCVFSRPQGSRIDRRRYVTMF